MLSMLPKKRYQRIGSARHSSANYKKLISEKEFLQVQKRARGIGVELVSIDFEGFELRFRTKSQSRKGVYFTEIIQLSELSQDDVVSGKNIGDLLRSAKLKVYCTSPAYIFWGYAYKNWRYGCGLYPERRYPKVRNPRLRGWVDKHLYAVLMTFPFLVSSIGKQLKNYWTEKQEEDFKKSLEKISKEVSLDDLLDS